jgi:hypothetical protein
MLLLKFLYVNIYVYGVSLLCLQKNQRDIPENTGIKTMYKKQVEIFITDRYLLFLHDINIYASKLK